MALRHPDLLAAGFVVAARLDPAQMKPLARQKLWFVVAEGDPQAYSSDQGKAVVLDPDTEVSRAVWDGRATPDAFAKSVSAFTGRNTAINHVVLQKGSVVPPGFPNGGPAIHVNTWRIAYGIEGIRDWMFRQKRG